MQNTTAAPYKTGKTFWDDLRFQITTLATGGTPPDPGNFGPSGSIRCYLFDGGSTLEAVEGAVQFPHAWKVGTTVYPHVHWAPSTTGLGMCCGNLIIIGWDLEKLLWEHQQLFKQM